jgi:hypothetical protein
MKDLDIRIRNGGDGAIAAVADLLSSYRGWLKSFATLAKQAIPRWIPVEERLPVDIPHGYCLVTDGENVGTANYSVESKRFDHCIDRDYWKPTHWMELPEPPEAK